MSHFQPNALTISRGEEWQDRRHFNETVLNTGHPVHEHAGAFLKVISNAVDAMHAAAGTHLTWRHFDELFEQIAAGILFGVDPGSGRPLFNELHTLMRESNRVFGLKKSKHFDPLYSGIHSSLQSAHRDGHSILRCIANRVFPERIRLSAN